MIRRPIKWHDARVTPESQILDAIRIIDSGPGGIALVTTPDDRLVGTVTDGDVRRGLLRGVKLDEPVTAVMNAKPRWVDPTASRDAIIGKMRAWGVEQAPLVDAFGRVVGLELFGDLLLAPGDDTWIVLMAGGMGTRLRPYTETLPKPMLPVGGKPIIQTIVESFAAQGFRRFFFSVNYRAEDIMRHFGDGEQFGVQVEYLHETERKGTAGALSLLREAPPGPVIVMNGDIMTSVDFRQLLRFHEEHGADATMCVREYSIQVPFGVVETDQHRLKTLQEKPVHSFFVNAGIYVLSPDALARVPRDRFYDMTDLFADLMAEGREASVFPLREYWLDVGRHEDLAQARTDAVERAAGDDAS